MSHSSKLFNTNQTIVAGTIWITVFVTGSKLLGFVRQLLAGMLFGTSSGYDAVIIALGPTDLVAGIMAGAFASVAIPLYLEEKNSNGIESAKSYARGILTFTSVFLIIFGITLLIFPAFYVKIFAPGFHGETLKLAENYLRIYSLLPLLNGWANLFGAFLRAERMFFQYAVSQFATNIFLIPALLIFAPFMKEGAYALSLEFGTGAIAFFAYLFGRNIWKTFPFGKISSKQLLNVLLLASPLFLSSAIATINSVVDKAFASTLEIGSVSALNYSFTIVSMINGIIMAGLLTSSLTSISESATSMDYKALNQKTAMIIEAIIKILAPITALTIVSSEWIVRIIYQRGQFTQISTMMTSSALIAYATMIITVPLTTALSNIYIAKKRTLRLTMLGLSMIFINAYMDWILMMPFKQAGIAASSSIVSFIWVLLLVYDLGFEFKMHNLFSMKTILPSILSFFYVIVFLIPFAKIPSIPKLLSEIIIALLMVTFFGRKEIKMVFSRFN
jgi:putative peptidoglycan lipid II flippase